MRAKLLSALLATGLLVPPAGAEETSFARVFLCKNEAGFAELYLSGAALSQRGPQRVELGGEPVSGYLAFDFTPVGKNKTLNPVRVSMNAAKDGLVVELTDWLPQRVTIPVKGGVTRFPQRLAEEMMCGALNKD